MLSFGNWRLFRSASATTAALELRFLEQVAILQRQQVALDLGDGIDGHVDDDQQAGSAEKEDREVGLRHHIFGQHTGQRPDTPLRPR